MKILITTDFFVPSVTGVSTVVVNEMLMLPFQGHEVRLLTIGDARISYFRDGVYHMKASRIKPFPDSYMTFSYRDSLLTDILAWKPDIIHSNNEFFSMGYATRIQKELHIPLLHTCHTDFTRYDEQQRIRHTLWDAAMAAVVKRRVRFCSLLISPSAAHKAMLERYRISKPIEVLPSGIELSRFGLSLPEETRNRIRSEYGFGVEHIVLISVCRLASEKRVNRTIDAFFLLSLLEPSVRLLIVGGGPKQESLKQQVRDFGLENRVIFTGTVPSESIHRLYQASDLFVSSSIRESQGLGFVEAMASGLPVLLREDGSLGFSIEESGCGFLYHDEKGFVSILSSLIHNPALIRQMGERAKKESERFNLERWACALSALCVRLHADFSLNESNQADHRRHDQQGGEHTVQ